jgi:hypothetical protein
MSEPDDAVIRAYLLGLLPDGTAEDVEEAYFVDPEVFARVRAVEDDLLDDYAAGRLGHPEKGAFEHRYLATDALRQRVIGARALRLAAPPARALKVVPRRRWLAPAAIAAGLLVAMLTSWLWQSQAPAVLPEAPPPSMAREARPTPSPSPSASLAPPASPAISPSAVAPPTTRLVLALSPTLLRGPGGPAVVRIPPQSDAVVLELLGDRAVVPSGAALRVSVETVEGAQVWSGPARRVDGASSVASAEVPADRLAPADYLVTLSAGDETLYRYFFRVSAR